MRLLPLLALLALVPACQANAQVSAKASSSGDVNGSAKGDMTTSESPAPRTSATVDARPPPSEENPQITASGAGSSCPFECFIADGADSIPVTAEEQQRLQGAFAGTMSGIHQCVGGGGGWQRRRSSPVLNVRVNFKGEVTDVGIDARGYDQFGSCIEGVQRPVPGGTFSGPSTIRCSERCAAPPRTVKSRATKAAQKAAPAQKAPAQQQVAPAPAPNAD